MLSKKLLAAATVGIAGVAALSGCSPSGSVAAVVNGVEIPDSAISSYAEGCVASVESTGNTGPSRNDLRTQMVTWAILGEMSHQQVERTGVSPSEDQIRDYLVSNNVDFLLADERCASVVRGVAQHDLIALASGQNPIQYFSGYTVELNPRYGTWNSDEVKAAGSGSLSELVKA